MKVRPTILVLAGSLALAPLALAQDHAVPRGGGDGGGGHAGGGGGHPGVSQSGGGSSSGGSTYSGSSAGGSSYSPSSAERRHPRAGTGRGGGGYFPGGGGYYPGGGGYYPCYGCGSGWYYPGYWGGYWWPYASYGWYGGYWGNPWGWGGGGGGYTVYSSGPRTGSVRVLVDPAEARVYVDGYYAGTVDDFDGLFQRLNVPVGRHEIAIKLEGYKTHRMKVYVGAEGTVKIQHDLERGTGETFEDLSGNAPAPEARRDRDVEDREVDRDRRDADEPTAANGSGRLRIDVRPADASVYVDGAFRGTAREATSLRLPAGRHRVEIVRPGYRTDERDVEVTAGETTQLEVDLERGSI